MHSVHLNEFFDVKPQHATVSAKPCLVIFIHRNIPSNCESFKPLKFAFFFSIANVIFVVCGHLQAGRF